MNLQEAIKAVTEKRDLDAAQMRSVMRIIMTGQAGPAQIGGFLIGLRMKGESIDEIAAAAEVMRELAEKVTLNDKAHLVDTCGTGGDALGTFNISTASAVVAAAAGAKVAKHGNRSVTSRSGSADVLETAGVKIDLPAAKVAQCIEECGLGFMFAPVHHGAMKHAIGPRKELAVRTVFNVLGPLTNPAAAANQVLGVFSRDLLEPLVQVLRLLGSEHVLVVHAEDGLDEISIASETHVAELKNKTISQYTITPEQFGFTRQSLDTVKVQNSAASLAMINDVFDGKPGAAFDIVAMNAGAAIYAANVVDSLDAGIEKAKQCLLNESAKNKFNELIAVSAAQ